MGNAQPRVKQGREDKRCRKRDETGDEKFSREGSWSKRCLGETESPGAFSEVRETPTTPKCNARIGVILLEHVRAR